MAGRLQTYVFLLVVLVAVSSFFDTNQADAYVISPSKQLENARSGLITSRKKRYTDYQERASSFCTGLCMWQDKKSYSECFDICNWYMY